ncbi:MULTISPECIES: haloacid dehalogenase type II [unclassified Vibrio]|uniref:(S)-2-haloacid dehalogenase n=1 Tax=Vibrio sp. HB236076 TaxID=3232307 RepID=A0AB39HA53_9VIBR|nr:haloacid dehalogenase type II [Vibrio sp. HB161653]MDP5255258.1 haloacid dehalogenase type II [Vibrio sp. HB161653]
MLSKASVLAFDVYGTLIDTNGVLTLLQQFLGAAEAPRFANHWRDKQLEYSFRRGLMGAYQPFATCTRDALKETTATLGLSLNEDQQNALMKQYLQLPAFDDVKPSLQALKAQGIKLVAFSNGEASSVQGLLEYNQIEDLFSGIVSCQSIEKFKPDPEVYQYLLAQTGGDKDSTWLISSNPFDVTGARSFGLPSAWLQRDSGKVFDPWQDCQPTRVIGQLGDLVE